MCPDILTIKYLLSEGVDIKTSNVFVDNSIIKDRAESCCKALKDAIVFKGYVVKYINPNRFIFRTPEGWELEVYSKKSVHLSENKDSTILANNIDDFNKFNLLYYDRD